MDNDIEEVMAKRVIFQILFIIILIVVFIIVGKIIFKNKDEQIIDVKTSGDYSIELIGIGDPPWPFGDHSGRIVLKGRGGKVICKEDISVNNDGAKMDKNNWTVTWEADRVVVTICGYDAPKARKYYLYFD